MHKKLKKNTRKIIFIKYKDSTESLILTETVKKRKKSLQIKIKCESLPGVEVNTQNEERLMLRNTKRIVPCCLRDKCSRAIQYKSEQIRRYRQRKTEEKSKSQGKNERKRAPSVITISDEEDSQYDGISSGTLSSYDSEIDSLLQSTRKRMKDSNEEWTFLPGKVKVTSENSSKNIDFDNCKSLSLNSLDTLVLDTVEDNDDTTQEVVRLESLKTTEIEVKQMPNGSIYEPMQISNKCKEYVEQNEYEKCDLKKIKLEPPDFNSNFYNESKQFLQGNETFQTCTEWQNNAYPNNINVVNNIIKTEPLLGNNGDSSNYETYNYLSQEDRKDYVTGTVRIKLERPDLITGGGGKDLT